MSELILRDADMQLVLRSQVQRLIFLGRSSLELGPLKLVPKSGKNQFCCVVVTAICYKQAQHVNESEFSQAGFDDVHNFLSRMRYSAGDAKVSLSSPVSVVSFYPILPG